MVRALRQLPRSPLRITSITICSNLYTAMSAASAVIVQTHFGLHLRSSRLTLVGASVFGGADRNFAYSRIAHKMGTFGRIASHVDSKFWNLLRSDWANGRRANDLKRVSIIVMFVWTSQQVQQILIPIRTAESSLLRSDSNCLPLALPFTTSETPMFSGQSRKGNDESQSYRRSSLCFRCIWHIV